MVLWFKKRKTEVVPQAHAENALNPGVDNADEVNEEPDDDGFVGVELNGAHPPPPPPPIHHPLPAHAPVHDPEAHI